MPKMRIYSVYDEKAEEFSPPFFQANDRMAQRMITESAKGNGSMLNAYPEDFKLYRIGEFDTTSGDINREERPCLICAVKDITKGAGRNAEN